MTVLSDLALKMTAGQIRVVDLTHTLDPDFPVIILPPEFGQCARFRMEEISAYDHRGPAWKWHNIHLSEHTGTHFDAPSHWISGRDLPSNSVDAIDPSAFVGPVVVLDCVKAAQENEDYELTIDDIKEWEAANGVVPSGAWVLMRTDWSKRSGLDYLNMKEDGLHSPGPSATAIQFLINERGILGFGTETVGTDSGQAAHSTPPYPAHFYLHGAGRFGLQCLAGLDQLPAKGAILIAAPLKIKDGTGSPLRVLALVEEE